MFDILADSTLDIVRGCLKQVQNGYVPEDLLVGGTSTLLNPEHAQPHAQCLTVTSHLSEAVYNDKISLLPLTYRSRLHGDTILKEVPSVFEPGTLVHLPPTPISRTLMTFAKLVAYATAHDEETDVATALFDEIALGILDLKQIIPTTVADRTKPWALDDMPRSYHVNGRYNLMQQVGISLGNYQTGVNTGGKSVNYTKLATVLRAVGTNIFGEEEWLSKRVGSTTMTLHYHLNLDEIPNVCHAKFLTPYVMDIIRDFSCPKQLTGWLLKMTKEILRTAVTSTIRPTHFIPVTFQDPNIRGALAELKATDIPKPLFLPIMTSRDRSDIASHRTSSAQFTVLPKPPSDKAARHPASALKRLMVPWLGSVIHTKQWPHTCQVLLREDKVEEAAKVLLEHYDMRIPKLAFQIITTHTPVERNVWKIYLNWLFIHHDRIPGVGVIDPATAYAAALKINPEHILKHYTGCYIQALADKSVFLSRDLLVPDDLSGLDNLLALRISLYKRVSKTYAARYRAKAEIHIGEFNAIKAAYKGLKWKRWPNHAKQAIGTEKSIITRYQWRMKCYPTLLPISHSDREFDHDIYTVNVISMLYAYARKRKKTALETEVKLVEEGSLMPGASLFKKLRHFSAASGLDLMASYQDVVLKRNQTLDDVDGFIKYDTTLSGVVSEPVQDLEWDEVSDEEGVEAVAPVVSLANMFDFLPKQTGFNAILASENVNLEYELKEDGIPLHIINDLQAHYHWELPETVLLDDYQDLLKEAKEMYHYSLFKKDEEGEDEEPDIS